MNFETILKYQELDIKLRKTLDGIEKSAVYENMERARQEFSLAKRTRDNSEKTAEEIIGYLQSAQKISEEINAMIESMAEKEEITDEEYAQLQKAKSRLMEIETKLSDRKSHSEKIIKEFLDANEQGKKLKNEFDELKKEYTTLKEGLQPEIKAITEELKVLESKIDGELLSRYKAITAEKKYPAFVDAYVDKDSYYCRGCGIALSQSKTSELKNNEYCICEKCKRVIYKNS